MKTLRSAKKSGMAPLTAEDVDHRSRTGALRREATRRKLIATAVAVFAEKGVDASSIDDFIQAAGVARGTFYNHFKTTGELLEAVNAALNDAVLELIDQQVRTLQNPLERVATGCLLYMRMAVDHPDWGRFVLRTGLSDVGGGKLIDNYLPRDLVAARETGQLRFSSERAARDLVAGAVKQGLETLLSGAVSRDHMQEVLSLILRGLGAPAASIKRLARLDLPCIDAPPLLTSLEAAAHGQGEAAHPAVRRSAGRPRQSSRS